MVIKGYDAGLLLKKTVREVWDDGVLGLSAQAAYSFFFSLFPILLFLAPLFSLIGNLGGLLIAVTNLNLSANYYLRSVIETVKYNDLASGIGKTFFFGFSTALIGCYNGLRTSGGADGVGRATTMTVVASAITVLIMDFFLTKLFLFLF